MKINSNTIKLEKESYQKLENIIKKIASKNKIENVENIEIKLSKDSGVVKFAIEEDNYYYDVIVWAPDGEHVIEENLKSYEEAKNVADEWLGKPATWLNKFQAVSMYGDKLFIEGKTEPTFNEKIEDKSTIDNDLGENPYIPNKTSYRVVGENVIDTDSPEEAILKFYQEQKADPLGVGIFCKTIEDAENLKNWVLSNLEKVKEFGNTYASKVYNMDYVISHMDERINAKFDSVYEAYYVFPFVWG